MRSRHRTRWVRACENAFFSVVSTNAARLAVPMIFSKKRDFPLDVLAHTVLRTTRRWLERLDIETVVFVGSREDQDLYYDLLPIYFPRSHAEASSMMHYVKEMDVGNAYGELVSEERTIRLEVGAFSQESEQDLDLSFLRRSTDNFDHDCQKRANATAWECRNSDEVARVYRRYLREASQYNFAELVNCGFLAFEEVGGRKIVKLLGKLFPARVDPHLLVLFIVSTLDPQIKDRYSLLYVHTDVSYSQNTPSWTLFTEMMRIFTTHFTPTLECVVILHPDLVFKAMFSVASLCIAHTLWPGIRYADRLHDVNNIFGAINLPEYVLAYDRGL